MKDLGPVGTLLGMSVTRNRQQGWLKIDQNRYIKDVLKRYNMETCHPTATPANPGDILSKEDNASTAEEIQQMAAIPYRSVVGSLMYAAHVTRLDVANAVRVLARYMANPGEKHWMAAKRCLRYLAGTPELGITYRRGDASIPQLSGYSDATWAGDLDNARSTTGVAFMLAGGAVSFTSRLQQTVARSSMESEYMALFEAAQLAKQLRDLLAHLGAEQRSPTKIYEDNEACATIANPRSYTRRARHIDVRFHFTREAVEQGIIELTRIATNDQLADILTKNLPSPQLPKLRNLLMG